MSKAKEILTKRYRYFVLDFGSPNTYTYPLFLNCDIQLVVGYTGPWKLHAYENFLKNHLVAYSDRKEVCFYIGNTMGSKADLSHFSKQLGVNLISMPILPNPFQITFEHFSFFEKILGGN